MESGTVEHLFYWYNRQHNGWNRRILPKTLHPSLWRCKLLSINTMTEWRVVLTLHHPSLPFTEFWLAFPRWRIAESVLIDLRNLRQNQQELLIWRWRSVKGGEGWWRAATALHRFNLLILWYLRPKSEGWRVHHKRVFFLCVCRPKPLDVRPKASDVRPKASDEHQRTSDEDWKEELRIKNLP